LVPGTRDSDRPATGLYFFSGRSQPVGITALRVTHTIQHASASLPTDRAMLAVTPGTIGEHPDGCLRALPIRSPKGDASARFAR
jgi:hypothetical protein